MSYVAPVRWLLLLIAALAALAFLSTPTIRRAGAAVVCGSAWLLLSRWKMGSLDRQILGIARRRADREPA